MKPIFFAVIYNPKNDNQNNCSKSEKKKVIKTAIFEKKKKFDASKNLKMSAEPTRGNMSDDFRKTEVYLSLIRTLACVPITSAFRQRPAVHV